MIIDKNSIQIGNYYRVLSKTLDFTGYYNNERLHEYQNNIGLELGLNWFILPREIDVFILETKYQTFSNEIALWIKVLSTHATRVFWIISFEIHSIHKII